MYIPQIYKSEVRNPSKQLPPSSPSSSASRLEGLLVPGEIDHGQQKACQICIYIYMYEPSKNLLTNWSRDVKGLVVAMCHH